MRAILEHPHLDPLERLLSRDRPARNASRSDAAKPDDPACRDPPSAGASRGRSSLPRRRSSATRRTDPERAAVREHRVLERLQHFGAIGLVRDPPESDRSAAGSQQFGSRGRGRTGEFAGVAARHCDDAKGAPAPPGHLQLEPLERLLDIGVAGTDLLQFRAQRAVEAQVVLIECPQAPLTVVSNDGTDTSKNTP